MGAEASHIERGTQDGEETLPFRPVLVILTVPHAQCTARGTEADYNGMNAADLMVAADRLDAVPYGSQLRTCDRRALQAALLLRAQIIQLYPRARVVLYANTDQPRALCDSNRYERCNLEGRVHAAMPALLPQFTGRRINIDVHSFPTKGLPGDAIARGDPRNFYLLTATGSERNNTSLEDAVELRGSAANLFLTMFPSRYGIPSALIEFYEDKGEYPLRALVGDAKMLANWIMLEFSMAPTKRTQQ